VRGTVIEAVYGLSMPVAKTTTNVGVLPVTNKNKWFVLGWCQFLQGATPNSYRTRAIHRTQISTYCLLSFFKRSHVVTPATWVSWIRICIID